MFMEATSVYQLIIGSWLIRVNSCSRKQREPLTVLEITPAADRHQSRRATVWNTLNKSYRNAEWSAYNRYEMSFMRIGSVFVESQMW